MSHFRKTIVKELQRLADAGYTAREAAKMADGSLHAVYLIAKEEGIRFSGRYARKGNPKPNSSKAARSPRDKTILAMFDQGKPLQDMATKFGITRERVRQIVMKAGRVPRREQSRVKAESAAQKKKWKWEQQKAMKNAFFAPYVKRIKAGESCWSASGHDPALQNAILKYCKDNGIQLSHKSRNPKYRNRKAAQTGVSQ